MRQSRKEWMREQLEDLVLDAIEFDGIKIKRLPTMHDLRCLRCGHKARVGVHPDRKTPRFKCSRCGTTL